MASCASAGLVISVLTLCITFCQQIERTHVSSTEFHRRKRARSSDGAAEESPIFKDSKRKFLVCYFASWATQRDVAKLLPQNIDPTICSHINYAFANLSNETLTMVPHSHYIDIEQKFYEHTVNLKEKNKKLKILLSLGGWGDSKGDKYSRMVSDPKSRKKFVKEAVAFLKKYRFDGLDIDWEFPVCWQADCSVGNLDDKENFIYLTQELRLAFDEESPALLLTVALSGSKYFAEKAYSIATMAKYVDFFNVMSYNTHGFWENTTGHTSEMRGHSSLVIGDHSSVSVMEYYVSEGSTPEKLMMGIPLYGRSFTLINPNINGIGAPISGPGRQGFHTEEKGLLAYFEICDLIKNYNWTEQRDQNAGPYAFHGDQWVAYDDVISAKEKALIILEKGYGGAVVWDISFDDFKGRCHLRTFPIIRELKMNLRPGNAKTKDIYITNGSSTITNKFKEIILYIATFVIFQEQRKFYATMN